MNKKQKQIRPFFVSFMSGLGVWLGDIFFYPFDTITARMRASANESLKFWNYTKLIIKEKGMLNLYKGITTTTFTTLLPSFASFFTYQYLRIQMSSFIDEHNQNKKLKLLFPFFIGGFSQLVSLLIQIPFDLIRMRFQIDDPKYNYKSIYDGIKSTWQQEGISRFYKSGKIYIMNMMLFTGIQLQIFEILQFYREYSFINSIINMVIVSIISCTLCNPLQVLLIRYAMVDTTKHQLHLFKIIKSILKNQGFSGFYKGYTVRVFSALGFNLFWFPIYAKMRQQYSIQLN